MKELAYASFRFLTFKSTNDFAPRVRDSRIIHGVINKCSSTEAWYREIVGENISVYSVPVDYPYANDGPCMVYLVHEDHYRYRYRYIYADDFEESERILIPIR